VTDKGQFFWSSRVKEDIEKELIILDGDSEARQFTAKARLALAAIDNRKDASSLLAELDTIAKKSKSSSKSTMQALLAHAGPGGGTPHAVRLWTAYIKDDTNSRPDVSGSKSLRVFEALKRSEKTACFSHAAMVAQKLKKKGGLVARDRTVPPVNAQLAIGDVLRDRRPMAGDKSTHRGDVFRQSGVSGAVAAMKKALDAGQVIHARVLSGVGLGTIPDVPPEPKAKPVRLAVAPKDLEEHSVLIIGYDDDTFVFNDPDATVSSSPKNGFGKLFFKDGRLSTADGDSDMPVDAAGLHARKDKRYQVVRVFTQE
jgi:hypothetical protein